MHGPTGTGDPRRLSLACRHVAKAQCPCENVRVRTPRSVWAGGPCLLLGMTVEQNTLSSRDFWGSSQLSMLLRLETRVY